MTEAKVPSHLLGTEAWLRNKENNSIGNRVIAMPMATDAKSRFARVFLL